MKLANSNHEITLDEWKMIVRYEIHNLNPHLTKEDWEEIEKELSSYSEEALGLDWEETACNLLL